MTHNMKAELFFNALGLRALDQCPIQSHICDVFDDAEYSSVESLVYDLQQAHYSAGSFGLIYTWELEDCLSREDWRTAIDETLEEYYDATGDKLGIERLTDALVFALDWKANSLSYLIESVRYWLVVAAIDSMDPSPELHLFTSEEEAQDFISEAINGRLDYIVQHSPHSISEKELEGLQEQETQLFQLMEV